MVWPLVMAQACRRIKGVTACDMCSRAIGNQDIAIEIIVLSEDKQYYHLTAYHDCVDYVGYSSGTGRTEVREITVCLNCARTYSVRHN